MKAVILLAGKGRRIQNVTQDGHKTMIRINDKPIIWYIIENLKKAGIKSVVPVLGYKGEEIKQYLLDEFDNIDFEFAWNLDYENTNNLVSLINACRQIGQEEFVMINGDMIFDYRILNKISKVDGSAIALDIHNKRKVIDSPGTMLKDGRIMDLGRHVSNDRNGGYAIGIYKFSTDILDDFMEIADSMVADNPNAGFHDPLCLVFDKKIVSACNVEDLLWMDVDEKQDIEKANEYVRKLGY